MNDILKKKNKKPLTYLSGDYIYSFVFNNETFVSVDNMGLMFISLDSDLTMELENIRDNIKDIVIKTIRNKDDSSKKVFPGKILKDSREVRRLVAYFNDSSIDLKMQVEGTAKR